MAAPTAYYVNPAIAGNSGTGTIGDPFGDLAYALDTVTRDATNGDVFHIKAGTAEILAASLDIATLYGTPTEAAPLVLRGYTTAAGDGGIAEINCNGNPLFSAALIIYLAELKIHNFGNNNGISVAAPVYRCEIYAGVSTPSGKYLINGNCFGCYIHDAGSTGIGISQGVAYGCYIYNCPTGLSGLSVQVGNIVVDCAVGISITQDNHTVIGNTIYSSTANTGSGIATLGADRTRTVVLNNIVVGYSGSGGEAILAAGDLGLVGYNAFFNNTANYNVAEKIIDLTAYDASLASSPFTNPAGGDFSLLTSVVGAIETAFPGAWNGPASTTNKADMGAVQNGAGVGGAVSISPYRGNLG